MDACCRSRARRSAARVPLKSSLMLDPPALALDEQDVANIVAFLMKPSR